MRAARAGATGGVTIAGQSFGYGTTTALLVGSFRRRQLPAYRQYRGCSATGQRDDPERAADALITWLSAHARR
jgi:hypothetical protein